MIIYIQRIHLVMLISIDFIVIVFIPPIFGLIHVVCNLGLLLVQVHLHYCVIWLGLSMILI